MSLRSAAGATLAGIAGRFRGRRTIAGLQDDERVDGKHCLVTGANTGLGRAIATELARRGGRVLMAGRTYDLDARDRIRAAAGSTDVLLERLDLADLASVRAFVEHQERPFDVVVLNAGVVPRSARRTVDGFEEGFQVNFLANFELVNGLLEAGAIPQGNSARIVFVSSESHRSAEAIDWDAVGELHDYGVTGAVREYGRTKLMLTTYAAELDRRLRGAVAVHALCPGAVNSRLAREAPAWAQPLLTLAFTLFFRAPEVAAEPVLVLACGRALEGRTGVYLHVMEEKPMAPAATDPEQGRRLWRACERLLIP